MKRKFEHPLIYNFGPGPAMLPRDVMQRAKEEWLDWNGCGVSVAEMSHRSDTFVSMASQMKADFRELLSIPDNYHLLFLHGGATAQFAMVPLNLLASQGSADYFHTGTWSGKAIDEARRFSKINVVSALKTPTLSIAESSTWSLNTDAVYVYYTDNETVNGVQFADIPDVGDIPLVVDMTSSLLSQSIDVSRYGIIFASAQKNIGLAGLTIVIIRQDLVGHASASIPSMYDYAVHVKHHSMFNTPVTYSWYIASLVLQWVKQRGGVSAMEKLSQQRSDKLYRLIDESSFYHNNVTVSNRSRLNVPFTLINEALQEKFLKQAIDRGLLALRGHRSVGGIRASMYNAMPIEGVDTLVNFMQDFERDNK